MSLWKREANLLEKELAKAEKGVDVTLFSFTNLILKLENKSPITLMRIV